MENLSDTYSLIVNLITSPGDELPWWLLVILLSALAGTLTFAIWEQRQRQKSVRQLREVKQEKSELQQQLQQQAQQLHEKEVRLSQQQKEISEKEDALSNALAESVDHRYELTRLNESLEKKVKERTQALQQALSDIIRSDEELDRFVYKASHDLRAPIARMQGMIQVAQLENDPEQASFYLKQIATIANDMDSMLSKLLMVNVINIDRLQLTEINFRELVDEVVSDLKAKHVNSPVDVQAHIGELDTFRGDTRLMEIILSNLLENALLFYRSITEEAPYVAIDVQKNRGDLRIIVQDNGTGIEEEHQGKVLHMFFKGTERSKGNGLGLYAVRRAVEKMHGTIRIDSEKGDYTKVIIRIPYDQESYQYDQRHAEYKEISSYVNRMPSENT